MNTDISAPLSAAPSSPARLVSRRIFAILRLVVAVAIIAAIIAQLARTLNVNAEMGRTDFGYIVTNFFSFFTIDSNSGSVVVLLVGAVLLARGSRRLTPDPSLFSTVRACIATYMIITGLVYNLLLRNIQLPQGSTVEWSNEILHVVAPVFLLLDWILAPGRPALPFRRLWAIIAFPVVWVVYTLVRGPLNIDPATGTHWYPYPFLNPDNAGGYGSVALYVAGIAVGIIAVGAGVIAVSRRWPQQGRAHAATARH